MNATDIVPLVNGIEYSWVDITVMIGGQPLQGITAINYKEEQEVENHFGAGRYPVSRSHGRITAEASLTLLMSDAQALANAAPAGRLQNYPAFDIVVAYLPPGGVPVTHVIKDCQFKSVSYSWSGGDTKTEIELPLVCTRVIFVKD